MTKPLWLKLIDGSEKQILNGFYTKRESDVIVERKHILTDLSNDSRIIKMNKLAKVIDIIFNLNKLDNSSNLEGGRPSNTLFTCYSFGSKGFAHFEPQTPQYKKLKGGQIVSLTLRITDQNGNLMVLHVRDCKI